MSSSGRSGGLGLSWNDEIKLEVKGYLKYHIDYVISGIGDFPWRFTCVYGDAQVQERHKTWDTLRDIACNNNHVRVVRRSQTHIDGFRQVVDNCALADLGF